MRKTSQVKEQIPGSARIIMTNGSTTAWNRYNGDIIQPKTRPKKWVNPMFSAGAITLAAWLMLILVAIQVTPEDTSMHKLAETMVPFTGVILSVFFIINDRIDTKFEEYCWNIYNMLYFDPATQPPDIHTEIDWDHSYYGGPVFRDNITIMVKVFYKEFLMYKITAGPLVTRKEIRSAVNEIMTTDMHEIYVDCYNRYMEKLIDGELHMDPVPSKGNK